MFLDQGSANCGLRDTFQLKIYVFKNVLEKNICLKSLKLGC